MKIASTQYTLDYECLEIFISGCKPPHCPGCHNSELWNFTIGKKLNKKHMAKKINSPLVKKIFVVGGEPLHQDKDELLYFLDWLNTFKKDIYLFTRNDIIDVDSEVLSKIDYIKTGMYKQNSKEVVYYGITLASDNQKIIKVR